MAKKTQHHKKNYSSQAPTESLRVLKLLNQLQFDLVEGQFDRALEISEMLINYLPKTSPHLPEVLLNRGTAMMALEEYERAYETLSQAARLAPKDGFLVLMYARSCMYAMQSGEALVALEQAIKADESLLQNKAVKDTTKLIRRGAEDSLRRRGKGFTLEQLIAQEKLEYAGLRLMDEQKWEEAEAVFRQVIAISDCLPQPHNNLASCLIIQKRFVEAEKELVTSLKMEPRNPVAVHNMPLVRDAIKTGKIPELGGGYHPLKTKLPKSFNP
ncbi:tetratricopeptide repeat protein [Dictyobacter formicarum]|uniref:Tetratricopeptide repeat protein n=1 Tax=Dictyobacter formicarum TaxID=2778368 RepID=A0ABQ3VJE9_9CHLR|nr:hypothetical protein [Dictyobacter formicarum]GHO85541.1 hypothetical protein KSZ_35470 [Dictyobacter formicarum]